MARRETHRTGGAARYGSGARQFPGNSAAGARAGGLGRDQRGIDRGKSAGSSPDVRSIRRNCRRMRGRRSAVAGRLKLMTYGAMIYDALIAPFLEFEFMRRALAAAVALALGGAPIGVFLMLRRMSLVGDAMAHAILPGAAIGFLLSGLNLFAMTTGGLIAGFTVAILAGVVALTTELKDDASLATFDPVFLRTVSRAGAPAHLAFLALVVINLVNGFHALGTLLAVGLMILPAGIARFWSRDITGMICLAVASAIFSGYAGLVLSFQTKVPSGPAIILVAAGLYVVSVLFGSVSGLVRQLFPGRHLEA